MKSTAYDEMSFMAHERGKPAVGFELGCGARSTPGGKIAVARGGSYTTPAPFLKSVGVDVGKFLPEIFRGGVR